MTVAERAACALVDLIGAGEAIRAVVEAACDKVGPERVALWLDGDRAELGRRIEAARKVGR